MENIEISFIEEQNKNVDNTFKKEVKTNKR